MKTQVMVGDPKEKICEAIEVLHAELLVMGSRAFGPIKRYISFERVIIISLGTWLWSFDEDTTTSQFVFQLAFADMMERFKKIGNVGCS